MKKLFSIVLSLGLLLSVSYVAEANNPTVKKYNNYKELNADYKGGVAETKDAKNKGGKTKYKPHVSKDLYNKNKGLDRDKDKIACER